MHCLTALDLDMLRRFIQQEPSRGPDLACDDRHSRLQAIHKDLTRSVRCIDTVVVADKRAITISQQKIGVGDRAALVVIAQLCNEQAAKR